MSKIKDSELEKRGGIEIITAEHFKHFQERLKERHNLDISWEEYQELIDPANNRFKGLIKVVGMFIDLQGFGNEEIEHLEKFLDVREVKKIVIINEEEIEVWLF